MLNKLISLSLLAGIMSTGASQASDKNLGSLDYSNTSTLAQPLLSNPEETDRLLKTTPKQSFIRSLFEMATVLYERGDKDQALEMYQDAVKQDYAPALHALALHFISEKENTDENKTKVFNWLSNAAEQGFAPAQYSLGCLYGFHHVRFVEKDRKLQHHWIQKAANQSLPEAEYKLGRIFERPKSDYYDPEKAILWLSRAAGQRHSKAAYELGHIYEKGRGIKQDLKAALQFYELAQKDGNKKAEEALKRLKAKKAEPSLTSSLVPWWN